MSAILGWRSIFWFLTIFTAVFLMSYILFVPETCRSIVGNGPISSGKLKKTLLQVYRSSRNPDSAGSNFTSPTLSKQPIRFPISLSTLEICLEREAGTLLVYAGVIFAGPATIATGLPSQYHDLYHFNDLQIGLSCIPTGVRSCLSTIVTGRMADWNYRWRAAPPWALCRQYTSQDLRNFPFEAARLEVALPRLSGICDLDGLRLGPSVDAASSGASSSPFLHWFAGAGAFSVCILLLVDVCPESAG